MTSSKFPFEQRQNKCQKITNPPQNWLFIDWPIDIDLPPTALRRVFIIVVWVQQRLHIPIYAVFANLGDRLQICIWKYCSQRKQLGAKKMTVNLHNLTDTHSCSTYYCHEHEYKWRHKKDIFFYIHLFFSSKVHESCRLFP